MVILRFVQTIICFWLVSATLFVGSNAGALTIEELESMTDEQQAGLDFYDVWIVALGAEMQASDAAASATIMIKSQLATLLYPVDFGSVARPAVDREFAEQIRNVELALDLEADGSLTWGEYEALRAAASRVEETPIHLAPGVSVQANDDYVFAEGTWTIEEEAIAFPINKSLIRCSRQQGVCRDLQALVMVPASESADASYQLILDESFYYISMWSAKSVIAQNEGECSLIILTINIDSDQVFETTSDLKKEGCSLQSLEKPRIARLVDGFEVSHSLFRDRRKRGFEAVNPAVRGAFERLGKALGK